MFEFVLMFVLSTLIDASVEVCIVQGGIMLTIGYYFVGMWHAFALPRLYLDVQGVFTGSGCEVYICTLCTVRTTSHSACVH